MATLISGHTFSAPAWKTGTIRFSFSSRVFAAAAIFEQGQPGTAKWSLVYSPHIDSVYIYEPAQVWTADIKRNGFYSLKNKAKLFRLQPACTAASVKWSLGVKLGVHTTPHQTPGSVRLFIQLQFFLAPLLFEGPHIINRRQSF